MVSKDHGPQRDILFAAVAESNVLTPVSVSLKPIRVSVNFQIDLLVGLLCLVDKCAKIMAIKERWHFLLSWSQRRSAWSRSEPQLSSREIFLLEITRKGSPRRFAKIMVLKEAFHLLLFPDQMSRSHCRSAWSRLWPVLTSRGISSLGGCASRTSVQRSWSYSSFLRTAPWHQVRKRQWWICAWCLISWPGCRWWKHHRSKGRLDLIGSCSRGSGIRRRLDQYLGQLIIQYRSF